MEKLLSTDSRKDPAIASRINEVLFDVAKVCNTAQQNYKSDSERLEQEVPICY
jgi:hypothetical protein